MKRSYLAVGCLPVAFLCTPIGGAQHGHDAGSPVGTVSFPVSCTPEARAKFNVAAALLYSFFWERIDIAVAEVLAADPTCAMAHWLKAVASLDNALESTPTAEQEQQGWAAVQRAKQLGGKTQRERDYVAAVEVVFKDHATVPFEQRAVAYERALEQIYLRYPEDSEAAVLYGFWLQVTADRNDQTYAQQLKSAEILEKVFHRQPDHHCVIDVAIPGGRCERRPELEHARTYAAAR